MLLLLALTPFSALTYLPTILLGASFGWDGAVAAGVVGGLTLLVLFSVRVLWWWRHVKVAFLLYEKGLVAVAADGTEAVYPWGATAVFTDGFDRYKLSNSEGTVVTLGAAHRGPALGGEKIRGLRTHTVIRGAQLPPGEGVGSGDPAGCTRCAAGPGRRSGSERR